jgi:hypothetical protein
MANAQQPMQRTRHIDIKKFAILDWVEQDLMILKTIKTAENAADGMTKPLARQLFSRHVDTIMGRRIPEYALQSNPVLLELTCSSEINNNAIHYSSSPYRTWGGERRT